MFFEVGSNVRYAVLEDIVIILDIRRGEYTQLSGNVAAEFLRHTGSDIIEPCSIKSQLTENLIALGLIERRHDVAKKSRERINHVPLREVLGPHINQQSTTKLLDVFSVMVCVAHTIIMLRLISFSSMTRLLARSRQKAQKVKRNPDDVSRLIDTYFRIRPWIFSVRDHCLFDSITLNRFLQKKGVITTVTIAVQCNPFSAHAWVDDGEVLYNDQVSNIYGYAPILKL